MARKRKKIDNIVYVILGLFITSILIWSYNIIKEYNRENKEKNKIEDKNNNESKNEQTTNTKKEEEKGEIEDKKENNVNESSNEKNSNNKLIEDKNNPKKQQKQENANKNNINIELIGERRITIGLNETYKDKGAKAYDESGKDVSSNLKVDNQVDTSQAGTYQVIYSIGNSTAVRTVTVE